MINELKEKICEVAENYDSQVKKCIYPKTIETHILPHERKVKITYETIQCPELLFQPHFYQRDHF